MDVIVNWKYAQIENVPLKIKREAVFSIRAGISAVPLFFRIYTAMSAGKKNTLKPFFPSLGVFYVCLIPRMLS